MAARPRRTRPTLVASVLAGAVVGAGLVAEPPAASVALSAPSGGLAAATRPEGAWGTTPVRSPRGHRARPYDLDGDGRPELVVGAPGLRVGTTPGAGGVVVLRGTRRGVSTKEKVVTQSSRGVPGSSETGDLFGAAVASADFDRDGYADLAIGQPGETDGGVVGVGAVTVVPGSRRGPDTRHARRIAAGTTTRYAGFGSSLATGDMDGDGYPDLLVGAPGDDDAPEPDDFTPSGTVSVLPGGRSGLPTVYRAVLHRPLGAWSDPGFGWKLATADLDRDGRSDVVVASEGVFDTGDDWQPASLSTCLGRAGGPTGCTVLDHVDPEIGALAVGRLPGSRAPAVVVGERYEGECCDRDLWLLRPGRVVPERQALDPVDLGVEGGRFRAEAASVGDTDRDGRPDLVVAEPGRVTVAHGTAGGWRSSGNEVLVRETPGVPDDDPLREVFGSTLTLLDHDRDGRLDLGVVSPSENGSGAVVLVPGRRGPFDLARSRTVTLRSLGYPHPEGARFGAALGR